ncbi:MutS-related protein [Pedobacter hiemivivus]|nr:RagB/SusD family nutrient uptake outer membrane protein [Pedobacter hiemivivus]
MRKYINIIAAGIFILSVISCKKSFLEVVPKGKLIAQTYQDYNLLMNTSEFYLYPSYGPYEAAMIMGDDVAALDVYYNSARSNAATALFRWDANIFMPGNASTGNSEIPIFLRTMLLNIYTCNKIINEVMDATKGTEQQKLELLSEAKAQRAFIYIQIINYFGKPYNASTVSTDPGWPIVTSTDITATNFKRNSLQEVYDFIIKDFKDAIPNLRVQQDFPTRMSKAAAEGLLGKLYLFMGNSTAKSFNKLSYEQIADYDQLFRFKMRHLLLEILKHIYQLDVYISVARVAEERNYVFPQAVDQAEHLIRLTELYHPLVKNAKSNSIDMTPDKNIVFLTGANMAGKSTFMKSLGIALYLAHMGFPVAAAKMQFSVRDGIYTTINLPDDLSSGNSHFYAEVLRVKKVAKELGSAKNLFVIFDELFRGTNVKDAYEGTIAITEAFAKKPNCMFVVSTHIIEAGEVLKERCSNINFVYLPTVMENNMPRYTYKLEHGITADRHGMVIINNERILEIIRSKKNKPTSS